MTAATLLSDEEVLDRVRHGETAYYEILMRRYNPRLYRIARGILANDAEAEDVMQDAYVRAFQHLDQFEGRARFSTWLTKIAVHEALARVRRRARFDDEEPGPTAAPGPDPERQAWNEQTRALLEVAIDSLPEHYRSVFVLRSVEEMDTHQTAECLGISPKTVKVRLHRARALLRRRLEAQAGTQALYPFHLSRCDRVVAAVFARLGGAAGSACD